MLCHSLPACSLRGRPASLRTFPEGDGGRLRNLLIFRILFEVISGARSIFLPALTEGCSEPAGLVDEVAQRLAGEETAAIVEDDLLAPVVGVGERRPPHAPVP